LQAQASAAADQTVYQLNPEAVNETLSPEAQEKGKNGETVTGSDGQQYVYDRSTGSWLLQSLMGVCGVAGITPASVTVPKYNAQTKNTEPTACINAQELLGKYFVGLFVETWSYYKGEVKPKLELFAAYTTERKSYREHNAGVPAADIDDAMQAMLHKSQKSKSREIFRVTLIKNI